jgi:hypothetical protein
VDATRCPRAKLFLCVNRRAAPFRRCSAWPSGASVERSLADVLMAHRRSFLDPASAGREVNKRGPFDPPLAGSSISEPAWCAAPLHPPKAPASALPSTARRPFLSGRRADVWVGCGRDLTCWRMCRDPSVEGRVAPDLGKCQGDSSSVGAGEGTQSGVAHSLLNRSEKRSGNWRSLWHMCGHSFHCSCILVLLSALRFINRYDTREF